jgi:hypothetical protein
MVLYIILNQKISQEKCFIFFDSSAAKETP